MLSYYSLLAMNTEKLLLFDFDGVIADSMKLVRVFYNKIHEKYGLPYAETEKDVSNLFHKNVYEGLVDAGLPEDKAHDFLEDMKRLTFENEDLYEPFDGIKDVLFTLKEKGYILGVISSNHTKIIEQFLEKYSFGDIFEEIHGAEERTSKVEKINYLMNKLGFDKSQTYYIGDTVGDIKEGRAAGVHTVAVSWGYHTKEELEQENPEYLFEKPEELNNI